MANEMQVPIQLYTSARTRSFYRGRSCCSSRIVPRTQSPSVRTCRSRASRPPCWYPPRSPPAVAGRYRLPSRLLPI